MTDNLKNTVEYSVIILAAGKSSRMGVPKWSLKYDENSSFIEHIISEYYHFGCKDILLVINETDYSSFVAKNYKLPENVVIEINKHPEWDRFYSLKLGAKKLKKVQSVFIHNVDNPFVNQKVLMELLQCSDKAEYVSPEFEGKGGHPFLISFKIINDLRTSESDQLHLKEFLKQYSRSKTIVNDESILTNINNEEEYNRFFQKKNT